MTDARRLAFDSLKKCEKDGKYSNLEVSASLNRQNLSSRDKALYTALVYGVIEKRITLDAVIKEFSSKEIEKLDKEVLTVLRLAFYQIMFMDKIPDHAVCDRSVRLIKEVGFSSSASFVNAVLRTALKNRDSFSKIISKNGDSAVYSIPEWIISLWRDGYGEEKTKELLFSFTKRPPTTLRVNTLKTDAKTLLEHIPNAHPHPKEKDIIILDSGGVEELYGYQEGLFFVQGTSSLTALKALKVKSGQRVIDVCSCPGGKSFSAAIEMENCGEVYSFDLHQNKLSLVDKGAKRLGIDIIKTKECDARKPFEELFSTADAVIADVTCSGLGIIAKKPDIKYKEKSEIERLPEIQYAILSSSAKYLKKGGRLLYSTCTLNPEENERVVDRFLKENPDFKREGSPTTIFAEDGFEDGFFYDILIKE